MSKIEITEDTIKYLEGLAKVKIPEGQVEKYQKEISDILGYIQEIQTLDLGDYTDGREVHINNFREDIINQDDTHMLRALDNAPDKIGNLFKVSQVIKQ
jgi:aspartyl-tRNA(Asn)/glutamyl-tRNA(Gln) amidotransferase subunit C